MNEHRENRIHIGFFGRCNVGKSTLINILANQQVSITSQQKGTTTDLVKKTMELFNVGIVTLIDTAGLDDNSVLGSERVKKTLEAVNLIDLAVIVVSENSFGEDETQLIQKLSARKIPYIIIYNKQDAFPIDEKTTLELKSAFEDFICVSDKDYSARERITLLIKKYLPSSEQNNKSILDGIISNNDVVVLVTPIDSSAPKGRMILPQVKMIREVLDNGCINIVVQPEQLEYTLKNIGVKPKLIITDSQAFKNVSAIVPKDIYLTSFSILLAKEKGAFDDYLKGTPQIENLKDNDRILLLENCTHQPTCEDIGRVKLPNMLKNYTKKNLSFKVSAGLSSEEEDKEKYALVIQCGGCMATQKQIFNRLQPYKSANVPITNYGMALAYVTGIFDRACEIFFNKK